MLIEKYYNVLICLYKNDMKKHGKRLKWPSIKLKQSLFSQFLVDGVFSDDN